MVCRRSNLATLAARKVLAILDRAEGRDFTDLWHLSSELGRASCIDWAAQLDDGISHLQITTAFSHLDRLTDEELPCDDDQRPTVRSWFAKWTEGSAERRSREQRYHQDRMPWCQGIPCSVSCTCVGANGASLVPVDGR